MMVVSCQLLVVGASWHFLGLGCVFDAEEAEIAEESSVFGVFG